MKFTSVIACLVLFIGEISSTGAQMHAYGFAAKVNNVGISNETLERSFQEYLRQQDVNIGSIRYPERYKALRRETLDLLIEQELVWQAAQKAGILASTEEVDKALNEMRAGFGSDQSFISRLAIEGYTEESYREHIRRLVSAKKYLDGLGSRIEVSDAEVHEFYTANPEKMRLPEAVRARHILIKLAPDADEATRQSAREKLDAILTEARQGADFASLAREYSEDVSAEQGGDLGYFGRGQMVKPFEDAAYALRPGQISEIVETPYGLHLIRLEDYREAQAIPEDRVRERIRALVREQKGRQAVEEKLRELRAKASIEILIPL